MSRDRLRLSIGSALAALLALAGGCGTAEREFPGHSRDQVWKAMVETSQDPRYPDWYVVENEVWRDDASGTVEIRRDIRRDLVVIGQKPRREEQHWKFTAVVQSTEPPVLTFSTSTACVPAHFWDQGQQFLNEVERRLDGMPLQQARRTPAPGFPPSPEVPDALSEQVRGAPVKPAGSEPGVPDEIPLPASVVAGASAARTPSVREPAARSEAPSAVITPSPQPPAMDAVQPSQPEPAPAAEPTPPPAEPAPEPAPVTEPAPAQPEPAPAAEPTPPPAEPAPEPAPATEPAPAQPEPAPAAEPTPPPAEPAPEPAPATEPAPAQPEPAPATEPAPAQPEPAPAPEPPPAVAPKPAEPAYPPPYETPPEPDQQPRKRPAKPATGDTPA